MIKGEEIRVFKTSDDVSVLKTENNKEYALSGWNGEKYTDCWQVEAGTDVAIQNTECEITPIYKEVDEDFDIIGWEIN